MPLTDTPHVKVFVYGTLKKGGFFFNKEAQLKLQDDSIDGTLYIDGSNSFPFLKLDTGDIAHGEVHIVAPSYISRLDRLEQEGRLYKRKWVVTHGGEKCIAYEWMHETVGMTPVEGGNWNANE